MSEPIVPVPLTEEQQKIVKPLEDRGWTVVSTRQGRKRSIRVVKPAKRSIRRK